jgi:hypothetical protein
MFKAYLYTTNDEKVSANLKHVNVKVGQGSLQKTIIWTKNSRIGRQEWEKACVVTSKT